MGEARQRVIRASEIGQYVYCARAWWLGSVRGLPPTNPQELRAGETFHARHGRGVAVALWLSRLAYLALALAVAAAVIWLLGR